MEPQQPQLDLPDDLLAYMAGLAQVNRDPVVNNALPAHQTTYQQYPAGPVYNPAGNNLPSGLWQPQPPFAAAMGGMVQFGSAQALPTTLLPSMQPMPAMTPGFAAHEGPASQSAYSGQPATTYRSPPPPRGSRSRGPQPPPAAHHGLYGPPQVVQRPIMVSSQVPPAALAGPPHHGQAHRGQLPQMYAMQAQAQMLQTQGLAQQPARLPQGQMMYPPTPGYRAPSQQPAPPPAWNTSALQTTLPLQLRTPQLPPSRDLSTSPWNTPIFTPSPTVSTPATTPGFPFTPSPAFGGTMSLPADSLFPRSATPLASKAHQAVSRAAHGGTTVAGGHANSTADESASRILKRRISDADEEACEPETSKRPATQSAKQARSTNNTIGRQVQSDNINLQSQRAPESPRRDATLVPEEGQEAETSPAATSEPHDNDVVATAATEGDDGSLFGDDDADDGSLFGDDTGNDNDAPATELDVPPPNASSEEDETAKAPVPAPTPEPTPQLALPGTEEQQAPAPQLEVPKLWLPGMDEKKPVPAPGAPGQALPSTDAVPATGSSVTGGCPIGYLAGTAAAPAATSDAGKATGRTGAAAPQASSSNGPPATQPPTAQAKGKKRGAAKKASDAGKAKKEPAEKERKEAEEHESKRRELANKTILLQNPEVGRRYSWMDTVGPAAHLATRSRPPPNLGLIQHRMATGGKRVYPMAGPAPLKKPYWCKTCWKNWVLDTFWYNPRQLEAHVKRKHPEQLGTGVWRHEGM